MPDAIFIVATEKKGESLPSGDSILIPTAEFSVNAMRFFDPSDFAQALTGLVIGQMREGIEQRYASVRILAPDGRPAEQFSDGYLTIDNLDEAVAVARRALTNSASDIRQHGFKSDTPIYDWQPGEPAKLRPSPSKS